MQDIPLIVIQQAKSIPNEKFVSPPLMSPKPSANSFEYVR
jgi:hypothetical protein